MLEICLFFLTDKWIFENCFSSYIKYFTLFKPKTKTLLKFGSDKDLLQFPHPATNWHCIGYVLNSSLDAVYSMYILYIITISQLQLILISPLFLFQFFPIFSLFIPYFSFNFHSVLSILEGHFVILHFPGMWSQCYWAHL